MHGKFGKPCPVCGTKVQRIVYAENECNYCPRCQIGGKLLADRALSHGSSKTIGPARLRSWRRDKALTVVLQKVHCWGITDHSVTRNVAKQIVFSATVWTVTPKFYFFCTASAK